jgi:hypothetical protein
MSFEKKNESQRGSIKLVKTLSVSPAFNFLLYAITGHMVGLKGPILFFLCCSSIDAPQHLLRHEETLLCASI